MPVAKSMRSRDIGYRVKLLPEGDERLQNILRHDKKKKNQVVAESSIMKFILSKDVPKANHKVPKDNDDKKRLADQGEDFESAITESYSEYKIGHKMTSEEMKDWILENNLRSYVNGKIGERFAKSISEEAPVWVLKRIPMKEMETLIAPGVDLKPLNGKRDLPIIAATIDDELEVLDGVHRVCEARYRKDKTILAWFGDPSVSESCLEPYAWPKKPKNKDRKMPKSNGITSEDPKSDFYETVLSICPPIEVGLAYYIESSELYGSYPKDNIVGEVDGVQYVINDPKKPLYITAFKPEGKVATLSLEDHIWNKKKYARISFVDVSKSHRQERIAQRLYQYAIKAVKKAGYEGLISRDEDVAAKKFAKRIRQKLQAEKSNPDNPGLWVFTKDMLSS